jgi:hypothetical protein
MYIILDAMNYLNRVSNGPREPYQYGIKNPAVFGNIINENQ